MKSIYFMALILLFVSSLIACGTKSKEAQSAKIQFTVGDVSLNGKEAKIGMPISDGDLVESGDQSLVRIVVGSTTVIQLKSNSRLVYNMDSAQTLELQQGWMSGVTSGKLLKGEYKIKTPTSVAAVRGTAYFLKVESKSSSYFCTCNGTVHQHGEGNEANAESVSASHHAARRYLRGGDGSIEVLEAGMEDHTDKDIEELAAVIEATIDWESAH